MDELIVLAARICTGFSALGVRATRMTRSKFDIVYQNKKEQASDKPRFCFFRLSSRCSTGCSNGSSKCAICNTKSAHQSIVEHRLCVASLVDELPQNLHNSLGQMNLALYLSHEI